MASSFEVKLVMRGGRVVTHVIVADSSEEAIQESIRIENQKPISASTTRRR